jgi:geranylgeranyl diphosphate synthase type II
MISSIWSARRRATARRSPGISGKGKEREKRRVVDLLSKPRSEKTADEVEYVFKLMKKHGCIRHGQQISQKFALKANALFERQLGSLPNSPHKAFLKELINYVVYRDV